MGLRQFFKRVLPGHHHFREHEKLQFLGDILHDPDIFHLTRRSVAGGVATGLSVAWIPVPIHMFVAALVAIRLRVNLPLAVLLVWITNPLTFAPLFYGAYRVGAWMLQRPPRDVEFELGFEWLSTTFMMIWEPLLLGCFVIGSASGILGYFGVQLAWRAAVVRKMNLRRNRKGKRLTRSY
ncbi:MAG TPA: DUF2062 domain-containing protein [Gammaproteobacteria bacterium]|jgi:uncharacterized protein (DUF2062 family)